MNRALSSRAILVAAILAICTIVGAQATREPAAQAAATKPTQVIVVRVEELRQLRAVAGNKFFRPNSSPGISCPPSISQISLRFIF